MIVHKTALHQKFRPETYKVPLVSGRLCPPAPYVYCPGQTLEQTPRSSAQYAYYPGAPSPYIPCTVQLSLTILVEVKDFRKVGGSGSSPLTALH